MSSVEIDFAKQGGLVPVIVTDHETKEVLMLAYMNQEAFEKTLALGQMVYWSRSRKELWHKGATSGHYQHVKSLKIDCDQDTLLASVVQEGAACHTGAHSCFFTTIPLGDDKQ
ncbi:phosphoribosyl-AMP cyclohydrolase [Streptococcus sp. DD12]|uniref:phosphoribosyl-AMP cyclohydrolase n=1 Tax=Streptococcus sp. DD12 TaxID=1777880 RepID=UPI000794B175|nr:phosphoribosyl-AMP cyclohydrolase [Streptococcus sp. DD12]KXT75624.1 Phosphoribosyl-AMP cyclohydrolase [Streptococcus sp. DD12]